MSESTVQGLKKRYYEALKQNRTGEPVMQLEHGLHGRSLKLGDLDSNVQDYINFAYLVEWSLELLLSLPLLIVV